MAQSTSGQLMQWLWLLATHLTSKIDPKVSHQCMLQAHLLQGSLSLHKRSVSAYKARANTIYLGGDSTLELIIELSQLCFKLAILALDAFKALQHRCIFL